MRERLAVRLYLAEAEYLAAQRHHDGSPLACARYRAALREWQAAETEALACLQPSAFTDVDSWRAASVDSHLRAACDEYITNSRRRHDAGAQRRTTMNRETFEGYLMEKSATGGWWVVDTESEHGDRSWLFKSKHEAMNCILKVLC